MRLERVIYSSRPKCAVMSCLAALMVAMAVVPIWIHPLALVIAVPALVLFLPFLWFFAQRVFVRRPAVTISDEGVYDSASPLGAGLVRWEELSDIGIYRFGLGRWLALVVRDPGSVLSRRPLFHRVVGRINAVFVPSPFSIPENTIDGSLDSLLDEIQSYYETGKH